MERYVNKAFAFDIETTSFIDRGNKRATMWCWTFAEDDKITIGRTWAEYKHFISDLKAKYPNETIIVYVHNLEFEFGFMEHHFAWDEVFKVGEAQRLCYARTGGVEYRCSAVLSGMTLEHLGASLKRPIKKLVGDLDYSLPRHCKTPISEKEMEYCKHDVMIISEYIKELMEKEGNISRIPLTKTSYVRRFVRNKVLRDIDYRVKIRRLKIGSVDEYNACRRAFRGGFVHANAMYSYNTLKDVDSYDITSSYPAVMFEPRYPMGSGKKIEIHNMGELYKNIEWGCCIFDVRFHNFKAKDFVQEDLLSASKAYFLKGGVINNGRIHSAEEFATTLTDVDFELVNRMYDYSNIDIGDFYRYRAEPLPSLLREAVSELFKNKQALAGSDATEYALAKSMLNSVYGMMVMDIQGKVDGVPDLAKYNNDPARFLFYPWGVFITAYARKNLFDAILACGDDYVYSDTDCVKLLNGENHKAFFSEYNRKMSEKIPECEGLGCWKYEGRYSRFKALGAKRYICEKDGKITIAVSGLGRESGANFINNTGKDPFSIFDDDLVIPPEYSGRLVHTHINFPTFGTITDYLGNSAEYGEYSSIHLGQAEYTFSPAISMLYDVLFHKMEDRRGCQN